MTTISPPVRHVVYGPCYGDYHQLPHSVQRQSHSEQHLRHQRDPMRVTSERLPLVPPRAVGRMQARWMCEDSRTNRSHTHVHLPYNSTPALSHPTKGLPLVPHPHRLTVSIQLGYAMNVCGCGTRERAIRFVMCVSVLRRRYVHCVVCRFPLPANAPATAATSLRVPIQSTCTSSILP